MLISAHFKGIQGINNLSQKDTQVCVKLDTRKR